MPTYPLFWRAAWFSFLFQVFDNWETEQEEYRRIKRINRRRKGKGPPAKGSGARAKKKKWSKEIRSLVTNTDEQIMLTGSY